MLATFLAPVLAPAFDGVNVDNIHVDAPAPGLRRFVVTCGEFVQVTLNVATLEEAIAEAHEYRQPYDDLAIWEGNRLVATITAKAAKHKADADPPFAVYCYTGLPRAVSYLGHLAATPPPRLGWSFIQAHNDGGWFALIDLRPAEQLDAMDRFMKGERDEATLDLVLRATAGRP